MATPCFYYPELTDQDSRIELSSSESTHLSKSRRLKIGHAVNVINGQGLVAAAQVVAVENRRVEVQCTDIIQYRPRASRITIATAIPKGDRSKVMIDMLTQLGVSRIIPMHCERSVTPFRANQQDKWQRIAIEACKQSQNPWLPQIESEWGLLKLVENRQKLASEGSAASPQLLYTDVAGQNLQTLGELNNELIVMIGPEGGFSESELAVLMSCEATPLTLSDHILRTEVAAVAAMSQLVSV